MSGAQQVTQLHARLVQLRLAVTDGAFQHVGDLVVLVAFDIVQDEDKPVTRGKIGDRAFQRDPSLRHVKINSATPGYTATDMNQGRGTRTVEQGARIIVELALLPDDGPSGGFFNDQGPVAW